TEGSGHRRRGHGVRVRPVGRERGPERVARAVAQGVESQRRQQQEPAVVKRPELAPRPRLGQATADDPAELGADRREDSSVRRPARCQPRAKPCQVGAELLDAAPAGLRHPWSIVAARSATIELEPCGYTRRMQELALRSSDKAERYGELLPRLREL